MNPLLYYDSIYSLTSMKKQEDSHRQFIFEFISNEWNKLLMEPATESDAMSENSFIRQLIRVSKNGREYSPDEINDHVGTMLVAVSFIYFCRLLFATSSVATAFSVIFNCLHGNSASLRCDYYL